MKSILAFLIAFYLLSAADRASAQWVVTNGPGYCDFFAVMGSNLFEVSDLGGISRSTDSGTTWSYDTIPLPSYQGATTMAVSGVYIFVGTNGGGVFLSTDSGASWRAASTGLTGMNVYAFAVLGTSPSAIVLAGTDSGFFRSTDNGGTWSNISSGQTINSYLKTIISSGTSLFIGTGNGVFRSTDSGMSWTHVSSGLTNNEVNDLAVLGTNLFAGTYGGGIFRSSDEGTSWTAMNTGLTSTNITALIASGTNLYTGTEYNNAGSCTFFSTDNGLTWVAGGLQAVTINALAVLGPYLFAGTTYSDDDVWRISISDLSLSSVSGKTQNSSFTIYPNPALDKLNISSFARGTIYLSDPLGRSYSIPTRPSSIPLPEDEGFTIDISSLPSGVYFVSDGVSGAKFVKE